MSLCAAQNTGVGVDLKFNVVIMLINKNKIKPDYDQKIIPRFQGGIVHEMALVANRTKGMTL